MNTIAKKISLVVLIVCLFAGMTMGQTTLSAGDIAIFGVNADAPLDFGFVLLKNIESGTEIRFTDSGCLLNGSFRGGEGAVKYTAPSALAAGTEITYVADSANFSGDGDASGGVGPLDNLAFTKSGDQLFAFQGASASPTFIYAIQTNSNAWQPTVDTDSKSARPPGLTHEENCLPVGAGLDTKYDNAAYDKSTMSGTSSEILAVVSTKSNWGGDNDTRYDLTTFDFTVTGEPPLPITLAFFTATAVNGVVELAWETASETNNARFLIYRNDEVIGSVDGAGTTTEPHNYTFTDNTVVPGFTYTYVLADIDYANDETRYEGKAVTVTANDGLLAADFVIGAAYPNPFNPRTVISMEYAVGSNTHIAIYDTHGILVEKLINGYVEAGNYELTWNASGIPSGVYIVKMRAGDFTHSQKIVLMK